MLRGDCRVDLSDWKARPVSKAIQLVLARPEPSSFTKWKNDISTLPPTVWWSAAALCGLLNGYRRLPTSFRGTGTSSGYLAIYSLHVLVQRHLYGTGQLLDGKPSVVAAIGWHLSFVGWDLIRAKGGERAGQVG